MTKEQALTYLYSSGFSEEQVNTIVKAFEPTTKTCKTCRNYGSHNGVCDICKDYNCFTEPNNSIAKNDKVDCKHTDCNNCVNHKYCDYEPFLNKPCVSSGVCEHDKNKVLDKITEIIEPLRHLSIDEMSDIEWQILQIIDKYKGESEDKE